MKNLYNFLIKEIAT